MKFTIINNEFYLNDVKLDKLISYSIEADNDRTKLTIELILDDVEIDSIMSKRRTRMEREEINQEINLLAEKVKKLAVRDFKKILEKKLSIDDLEAEVVKLNVNNVFRGLYLNELRSLYSEYKKNIQIQFPIPEYLED